MNIHSIVLAGTFLAVPASLTFMRYEYKGQGDIMNLLLPPLMVSHLFTGGFSQFFNKY